MKYLFSIFFDNLLILLLASLLLPSLSYSFSWNGSVNSIPFQLASHCTFTLNNTLYLVGGSSSFASTIDKYYTSQELTPGQLGQFSEVDAFPERPIWHSCVTSSDNAYVLGGHLDGINGEYRSLSSVYLFEGNSSSWKRSIDLPAQRAIGGSIIINSYIYFLGGIENTTSNHKNTVYYSKINDDGSLQGWQTTTPLPNNISGFGITAYDGAIYIFGGVGDDSGKILKSTPSQDGTIDQWEVISTMPGGITNRPGVAIHNGRVFIVSDRTYYKPLSSLSDQNISWELFENDLPNSWCCGTVNVIGDYLYAIGGFGGNNYLNNIYSAYVGDNPPPSPTPSPTTAPKSKIVLIPGMGASYSYDGLVKGDRDLPNSAWSIPNYIKAYNGLISAIERAGYEKGEDFFVYAYDWRRPLQINQIDLTNFINSTVLNDVATGTKVSIVGHSMGGLLGSLFASENQNKVDKLIAVGSPFNGTLYSYDIWEGADFSRYSGWQSLGIRFMIESNKNKNSTQIDTIRLVSPSIRNVLPTFPFLFGKNASYKQIGEMIWTNDITTALSQAKDLPFLTTISSNSFDTPSVYPYIPRSQKDAKSGLWEDGKPVSVIYKQGDGTVLGGSAAGTQNSSTLNNLDHIQLVSSQIGQNLILQKLGINQVGEDIIQPKYEKSLYILIASPAIFKVTSPSGIEYLSEDGYVLVDNPEDGNWKVNLTSTGSGDYKLYFGRINDGESGWSTFEGTFTSEGQVKQLNFPLKMKSANLGSDPISDAADQIEKLLKYIKDKDTDLSKSQRVRIMARVNFVNLQVRIANHPHLSSVRKSQLISYAINSIADIKDDLLSGKFGRLDGVVLQNIIQYLNGIISELEEI